MIKTLFRGLTIPQQIGSTLVGLLIAAAIFSGVKYWYDSGIKKTVVADIQTQTQTQEGEAIEQANTIKQADSKLNSGAVRQQLQQRGEFRQPAKPSHSGEQAKRVPGAGENLPFYGRHKRDVKANQHTQQNPRTAMPFKIKPKTEIIYGFDESGKIKAFETYIDGPVNE